MGISNRLLMTYSSYEVIWLLFKGAISVWITSLEEFKQRQLLNVGSSRIKSDWSTLQKQLIVYYQIKSEQTKTTAAAEGSRKTVNNSVMTVYRWVSSRGGSAPWTSWWGASSERYVKERSFETNVDAQHEC